MSKKTVKKIYITGMIILLILAILNLVLEDGLLNPFIIFGFMFILLAVNIYNNARADGEDKTE